MPQRKYHTLVFRLHALTNLHVGAGDSFYGAVDKAIQTDAATGLPTIHSHSLKGAFREHFEEELGFDKRGAFIKHVFGSDVKGDPKDAQQGEYQFFGADLLSLPVPERDALKAATFHLASSIVLIEGFLKKLGQLGCQTWTGKPQKDFLDLLEKDTGKLQTGNPYTQHFYETARALPVVARNQLDNGISENLWYEEYVPHQALFGAVIRAPEESEHLHDFIKGIDGKVVQIGANATVGYGYCQFSLLNPQK